VSTVVIRVGGTNITADVIFGDAAFVSQVNGNPGACSFRVKDNAQTYAFTTGAEVTLDIDSVRTWGGYITQVRKTYVLPVLDADPPTAVHRVWSVTGLDYNVLFNKRIVWKESAPTGKLDFEYSVNTYDDTIINDIFDNYLTISGDGLTRTGVTRIDKAILDLPGLGHKGLIASAGFTWKEMMDSVARATGGMYYISPDKDLAYVDVETADGPYQLQDLRGVTWQDYTAPAWVALSPVLSLAFVLGDSNYVWQSGGDGTTGASRPDFTAAMMAGTVDDGTVTWFLVNQWVTGSGQYLNSALQPTIPNGHAYVTTYTRATDFGLTGTVEPTWPTDGSTVTDVVIGYQNFSFLYNGSDMINDMFVWGAGNATPNYVFSRSQDSTSITNHGRWQSSLQTTALYRQTSADAVATSYVYGTPQSHRGGKDDQITFTCRVFRPVYHAGSKISIYNSIFNYYDVLPVRQMTVTFVSPTEPIFDLTLSHDIDLPYAISEFLGPGRLGGGTTGTNVTPHATGITDTFTRVVSSPSWGTSDAGLPWSVSGISVTSADVNGARGCLQVAQSDGSYVASVLTFATKPFLGADIAAQTDWPFGGATLANFWIEFHFVDGTAGNVRFSFYDDLVTPTKVASLQDFGPAHTDSVTFSTFSSLADNVYRFVIDAGNLVVYAWTRPGGPGAAILSIPIDSTTYDSITIGTDGAAQGGKVCIDYVDLKGIRADTIGAGTTGFGCESFIATASQTTFTVSSAIHPLTSEVSVAGLRMARGVDYTETPETGTIVFGTGVTAGVLVYICYTADGAL